MKQIVLESPRTLAVREVERPEPGPGEALLKMQKVGVCGSDMHLYRQGHIGDVGVSGAFVIGHECMGTVAAVGEGVDPPLEGRRVAVEPAVSCGECRYCTDGLSNLCPNVRFFGLPPVPGALQEYVCHPARLLEPLPDGVSDEAAVVLEPMAIALHAVNLVPVVPGRRVAILGTGVLGTCVLELLGLYDALHVVCADLQVDRLERARQMGAAAVVNAAGLSREAVAEQMIRALGSDGAQVVFECCGVEDTLWNMVEVAAPAAHLSVIGSNPDDRVAFSSSRARRRGLTLRFVRRSLNTMADCLELAAEGAIEPGKLATHVFPASRAAEAFETVDGYADGVLKALIDMEQW